MVEERKEGKQILVAEFGDWSETGSFDASSILVAMVPLVPRGRVAGGLVLFRGRVQGASSPPPWQGGPPRFGGKATRGLSTTTTSFSSFETVRLSRVAGDGRVARLDLARPEAMNALNPRFWREFGAAVREVATDSSVRCCVVTGGASKHFTVGLDLRDSGLEGANGFEAGRRGLHMAQIVESWSRAFRAVSEAPQPFVAAVHGACIGAGVDLLSCCDVNYASVCATFAIAEVDVGIAADMGSLQRWPRLVANPSVFHELVYTARRFDADTALSLGIVGRVFPSQSDCVDAALSLAATIAEKSPVAVASSKRLIRYSRDHSFRDNFDFAAAWNGFAVQTADIHTAIEAFHAKTKPNFPDLAPHYDASEKNKAPE